MSSLQWALLVLGAGIALALVVSSLREKRARNRPATPPPPRMTGRDWEATGTLSGNDTTIRNPPGAVPATAPAAARERESFDELGVGKPRRRQAPGISEPPAAGNGQAAPALPHLVVGLYIAEHEGTNILGPKIHTALKDRGLKFGARKIYHRYEGDAAQFSVASLVKPGELDPAQAEGFATPGLSVFMVLPGPAKPLDALQNMLETARGLAKALNAELYDSEQRAPLSTERERELRRQVEEWARRSAGARTGA